MLRGGQSRVQTRAFYQLCSFSASLGLLDSARTRRMAMARSESLDVNFIFAAGGCSTCLALSRHFAFLVPSFLFSPRSPPLLQNTRNTIGNLSFSSRECLFSVVLSYSFCPQGRSAKESNRALLVSFLFDRLRSSFVPLVSSSDRFNLEGRRRGGSSHGFLVATTVDI